MFVASMCMLEVARSMGPFDDDVMHLLQVSKTKRVEAGPCSYTEAACSAAAKSLGLSLKSAGNYGTKGCYQSNGGPIYYGRIGSKDAQSAAEIGQVNTRYNQTRIDTCTCSYTEAACSAAAKCIGLSLSSAGNYGTKGCYQSNGGPIYYGRLGSKDAQSAAEIGQVNTRYKQTRVNTCGQCTCSYTEQACSAAAIRQGSVLKSAGNYGTKGCYQSNGGPIYYGRLGSKDAQSAAEIGQVNARYNQTRVNTCEMGQTAAPTTAATAAPTIAPTAAPTTAPTTAPTAAPTTAAASVRLIPNVVYDKRYDSKSENIHSRWKTGTMEKCQCQAAGKTMEVGAVNFDSASGTCVFLKFGTSGRKIAAPGWQSTTDFSCRDYLIDYDVPKSCDDVAGWDNVRCAQLKAKATVIDSRYWKPYSKCAFNINGNPSYDDWDDAVDYATNGNSYVVGIARRSMRNGYRYTFCKEWMGHGFETKHDMWMQSIPVKKLKTVKLSRKAFDRLR